MALVFNYLEELTLIVHYILPAGLRRDLGPLLPTICLKLSKVLGLPVVNPSLQLSPKIFYWV